MSVPVIEAIHLGKRYRLGENLQGIGSKTFRDAFSHALRKIKSGGTLIPSRESIWALKDVSFSLDEGEIVGIIGRNGAGKSTLLKILAHITRPTTGSVRVQGRVASLLEVGTGFSMELTGRENIYLIGAVLGMQRAEITRRFDEIVAFSEVEPFLDTPVKRYSSGMFLRLAFSVAAHLEADILLVDEVLAVGDIEFQKKCLGKMGDVVTSGRTVVFVSHNLSAMMHICQRGLYLRNGEVASEGTIEDIIHAYLQSSHEASGGVFIRKPEGSDIPLLLRIELFNARGQPSNYFNYNESLTIRLHTNPDIKLPFGVSLRIKDAMSRHVAFSSNLFATSSEGETPRFYTPGDAIEIDLPVLPFTTGRYYIDIICNKWSAYHVDNWFDDVWFEIIACQPGSFPFSLSERDELGPVILQDTHYSMRSTHDEPIA